MVSEGYLELIGKRESEVIGKFTSDIIGCDRFKIIRPFFEKALLCEPVDFSIWFESNSQNRQFLHVRYAPVRGTEGDLPRNLKITIVQFNRYLR